MLRVYAQRVLNLKAGQIAIIANGRVLGPLAEEENFTLEDFNLLMRFSGASYLDKIIEAMGKDADEEDGNNTRLFLPKILYLFFLLSLRCVQ